MARKKYQHTPGGDMTESATELIDVGAGSDSVTYEPPLRALWTGTGGAIALSTPGTVLIVITLPANTLWPCYITQVWATSTTATGMIGMR